ncbi:MAG: ATP/GTP phosphatase [Chloroflexi bacterium]|nr:ATP/GTP phosphatase [Chloroflexota bacterium]
MLTSFTVENFRGFDSLTIEPFERINLIAGRNNIGKTALLEAFWLYHGYHNPELGLRLRQFRGFDKLKKDEFLWDMFLDFDPQKTIALSSRDQDNRVRSLRITIQEHPTSRVSLHKRPVDGNDINSLAAESIEQETTAPIESRILLDYTDALGEKVQAYADVESDSIRFKRPPNVEVPNGIFLAARRRDNLEALAERFSNLAVDNEEDKIVQILGIIEPRLKGLTVQHRGGSPIIYGDIGAGRKMPLPLMGDGTGRLLGIALAISEARDAILLVDEIENGLHYTVMEKVWRGIANLAREYNVQVFATTHSEECLRAAHRAFSANQQYDFALHRLERVEGKIQVVTFDRETLDAAIEMDAEVR